MSYEVALLAEGVDRNMEDLAAVKGKSKSPSSRRAWIEIGMAVRDHTQEVVALLAEGVDRNSHASEPIVSVLVSPSSRRAWIEIRGRFCWSTRRGGRPPRGGRG